MKKSDFLLFISFLALFSIILINISPINHLLAGKAVLSYQSSNNYYFSSCASGGSGTQADPYCLINPNSNGLKTSFAFLLNSNLPGPVVSPGDTIILCAGACDGSGTATYNLEGSVYDIQNRPIAFPITVDGTSTSPITITTFPGETIILSGDTNGDKVYQTGELQKFSTSRDLPTGYQYHSNIYWIGHSSVQHSLKFERTKGHPFELNHDPKGWVFDNVEVRYIGVGCDKDFVPCVPYSMWPDADPGNDGFYDRQCPTNRGSHVFKYSELSGPFIIRNSKIHHICGFAHRGLSNTHPSANALFENNEYYNLYAVANPHNGITMEGTWIFRNNYVHDTLGGPSPEQRMSNILIEDNFISCPGEYKLSSGGWCAAGIDVSDGEGTDKCGSGGSNVCDTKNVTIRRNIVFAQDKDLSWYFNGIIYRANNYIDADPQVLIENNIIYKIRPDFSGRQPDKDGLRRTALSAYTNKPITLQHNTVYNSRFPAALGGANHIFRNNLIVREDGSSEPAELYIYSSAVGSIVENNNIWDFGEGGNVIIVQGGSSYTCSEVSNFGTGNICQPVEFVNIAGINPVSWDLHLSGLNSPAVIDALSTSPVNDDIDKDIRPIGSGYEYGGDEFNPSGSTTTSTSSTSTISTSTTSTISTTSTSTTTSVTTTTILGCNNAAFGKPVSESGSHYGALIPDKIVDGIINTFAEFWAGVGPSPNHVTIDLGQDYNIDNLRVRPFADSTPNYYYASSWNVKYSNDGISFLDFTNVNKLIGSGTLSGPGISITNGWPPGSDGGNNIRDPAYENYEFTFDNVTSRYIRVEITLGDSGDDSNLEEVQVCGSPINGSTSTTSTSTTTSTTTIPISPCTLSVPVWNTTLANEGELVGLTVIADNCQGETVNFTVMEEDTASADDPALINPASKAITLSSQLIVSSWIAEWQNDCAGTCNPPEYYFIASIVSNPSIFIQSAADLLTSQSVSGSTSITTTTIAQSSGGGSSSSSSSCTPDVQCSSWSECINTRQSRTCTDINGCNPDYKEFLACQSQVTSSSTTTSSTIDSTTSIMPQEPQSGAGKSLIIGLAAIIAILAILPTILRKIKIGNGTNSNPLRKYVKDAIKQGYSKETIIQEAQKRGWPNKIVDDAFK